MSVFAGRLLNENLSTLIPEMQIGKRFWRTLPGQNTINQVQLQRASIPDGANIINPQGYVEWVPGYEQARNLPITEHFIDRFSRQPGSGYTRTFDDIRF